LWLGFLQVEKFAAKEVELLEAGLEGDLQSFGKGFTIIEQVHSVLLRIIPPFK
jgi:hypothetical protein